MESRRGSRDEENEKEIDRAGGEKGYEGKGGKRGGWMRGREKVGGPIGLIPWWLG